jgi:hypothetical protein
VQVLSGVFVCSLLTVDMMFTLYGQYAKSFGNLDIGITVSFFSYFHTGSLEYIYALLTYFSGRFRSGGKMEEAVEALGKALEIRCRPNLKRLKN